MFFGTSVNDSPVVAVQTGAAITAPSGLAVKFSSGKAVKCATAGERALGVVIMQTGDLASGDDLTVQVSGIGMVKAGAAVAVGAELAVDANAAFVTATAGDYIAGVALDAASAAGEYIRAIIGGQGYKPAA